MGGEAANWDGARARPGPQRFDKPNALVFKHFKKRSSQRLTGEESPESRMREIRTSGLMRGGRETMKLTTTVCLIQRLSSAHSTTIASPDFQLAPKLQILLYNRPSMAAIGRFQKGDDI